MTATRRLRPCLALLAVTVLVLGCGPATTTAPASAPATTAPTAGSAVPGGTGERPAGAVRVPGTSVWLVPGPGFVAATTFAGFAEPNGAAVEVTEVPEPFDVIAPQVTAAELATQGIDVDTRDEVTLADGRPGILVSGTQTLDGIDLQKIILVTGDEDSTALVTANVPFASPDDIEPMTLRMVLSTWFEGGA